MFRYCFVITLCYYARVFDVLLLAASLKSFSLACCDRLHAILNTHSYRHDDGIDYLLVAFQT